MKDISFANRLEFLSSMLKITIKYSLKLYPKLYSFMPTEDSNIVPTLNFKYKQKAIIKDIS